MPYLGNEVAPLVQALEGKELKLDSDGDSSITADTDDQVDIKVGGSDIAHVTSTGLGVGTNAPTMPLDVICANNKNIVSRESTPNITNGFEIVSNDSSNQAQFVSNSATGEVNLGAINTNYFLTFSSNGTTERMRITTTGTIGLGTHGSNSNINNSILLTATGNGTHDDHFWSFGPHFTGDDPAYYVINHSSVGVYLSYGGNSWSAHSDERIKENITPLENVLPDIKNIRCVKYNLKGQPTTKIGFIAQDWESKFSEVVDENSRQVIESDGTVAMDTESESTTKVKAISYTETIPVLLKSIQELLAKVETLEAEVAKLKG
tara:strand:+ start:1440 stop:2399 length:960 start_codon:yes stop_codon:yes gene_type:complete